MPLPQLETRDRLVRFYDGNWNLIGHVFADLSDRTFDRLTITVFGPDAQYLMNEVFAGPHAFGGHISTPGAPCAWRIERWSYSHAGAVRIEAESLDAYFRSRIPSVYSYLDNLDDYNERARKNRARVQP